MFIKLGMITGIVLLGGMIFSDEIDNLFPTTSATVVDSLKDDMSNFSSKASDSVEKRIDKSIDKIADKTGDAIADEINDAGEKISSEISEVKDSSQKTISEKISNFNPAESISNIFNNNLNSQHSTELSNNSESIVESTLNDNPIQNQSQKMHETLSLSTTQQSNDILLQYSDSSGKTTSVNVIIRTDQKEIFSGMFFTSMFETNVNDISSVPYYVDMLVEHEDYGIVTSSVFNPGDSSNSKINGIFYNHN